MLCAKCGRAIPDDDVNFCPHCGFSVQSMDAANVLIEGNTGPGSVTGSGTLQAENIAGRDVILSHTADTDPVSQIRVDLVRDIARLAVEFERLMASVRSPVTYSGEYASRVREEDEDLQTKERRDEGFARSNRLNLLHETLTALQSKVWETDFILGEDLQELIQPYHQAYRELHIAIMILFSDPMNPIGRRLSDLETLKNKHHVLYSTGDDELSILVAQATVELKTKLKSYLPHNLDRPRASRVTP